MARAVDDLFGCFRTDEFGDITENALLAFGFLKLANLTPDHMYLWFALLKDWADILTREEGERRAGRDNWRAIVLEGREELVEVVTWVKDQVEDAQKNKTLVQRMRDWAEANALRWPRWQDARRAKIVELIEGPEL